MRRVEISRLLARELDTSVHPASSMLNALERVIRQQIDTEGDLTIPGIVRLTKRRRAPRMSYNGLKNDGSYVRLPARDVMTAKALMQP